MHIHASRYIMSTIDVILAQNNNIKTRMRSEFVTLIIVNYVFSMLVENV